MQASANALRRVWHALGPGLVTGAADDDPSGIATYSQAGAQFGFALSWTMLLTLPFMAAIQIISACIGWETSAGLARNIKRELPAVVLYALVALLAVANTINIAADLAAMGESLRLVVGGPALLYAILFGLGRPIAEVLILFASLRYAGYLKLLTLVLLAYVAAAFSVHISWGALLRSLLIPTVSLDHEFLLMVVAIFGTTISPYLFFWQASQEAEESRLSHRGRRLSGASQTHPLQATSTSIPGIGMAFSNIIAVFIIATTAATLHASGITKIDSAAQAAEALRPLAGQLTFALFAGGIIGTGLLAVPVLAGSAAYAIAEAFGMRGSLELPAQRAIGFYAIVGAATLAGAGLTLTNIDPITMLFWTAVINGIVAVPIMVAMMVLVSRSNAILSRALPGWLKLLGWLATGLMAVAVGLLAWSF